LFRGVRSVRTGPCLGVGITTDLSFAGFAMTVEFASTHSELRTARK
jgi:hypothetical protein